MPNGETTPMPVIATALIVFSPRECDRGTPQFLGAPAAAEARGGQHARAVPIISALMSTSRVRMAATVAAWLGGGAFVASLAYFARFYAHDIEFLPDAPTALSRRALLVDAALFTLFALHHSALARPAVKQHVVRRVPAELERSLYVWTASLLFAAVCALWQPVAAPGVRLWTLPSSISLALQIGGIALIALAARSIDALELAGIRQVLAAHQRPGKPGPRRGPPGGISAAFPYSLVRHPIYLGWILATFGATPMTADRFWFSIVSAAYLVAAVPWEEKSLGRAFGDAYDGYRARVRWRLIPGLY
jgi:protein-S-isoprenylcysteine O-methyltransferase Ste14